VEAAESRRDECRVRANFVDRWWCGRRWRNGNELRVPSASDQRPLLFVSSRGDSHAARRSATDLFRLRARLGGCGASRAVARYPFPVSLLYLNEDQLWPVCSGKGLGDFERSAVRSPGAHPPR
jgi:hypothetical protein